jgi:hypothetical protein
METPRGYDGGLEFGGESIIFVGNSKDLSGGRRVTGVPTGIILFLEMMTLPSGIAMI